MVVLNSSRAGIVFYCKKCTFTLNQKVISDTTTYRLPNLSKMRLTVFFIVMLSVWSHSIGFSFSPEEKKSKLLAVPMSGTYAIPGDFATINDAAISLNANGIMGHVIFYVAANHTETAPSGTSATVTGGIIFGNIAGTSALSTITFQKTGSGANPLITAGANHFAGGIMDAVVKIIGTDYLTFNGIDVRENPLNTNTTIVSNNMTEFGFGFFYANPAASANGAQNNTIQNCTISMNTGNTNYPNSFGVYSTTVTSATNGTGTSSVTTIAGSNSNNKLYGNTINNANFGIVVIGSNTFSAMDLNWDIGGNSIATGNTITHFGIANGTAASAYVKLGNTVQGILVNQIDNHNVSNNTITSMPGTATTAIVFSGIMMGWSGTMVQSSGSTSTCNNNTINITNQLSENTNGIWSRMGTAGTSKTFNSNTITIVNTSTTVVVNKFLRGILQEVLVGELITSGNTISLHYENIDHGHAVYFIQQDIATSIRREINDNILRTPIGKSLRTTGTIVGISHNATSSGLLSIKRNTISINKGNGCSTSLFYGVNAANLNSTYSTFEITDNTILLNSSCATNVNTSIVGINNTDGTATTNKTITSNTINVTGLNTGGTSIGINVGRTGLLVANLNQITVTNSNTTIYGILATTGCMTNTLNANIINIAPLGIVSNSNLIGISNNVGIGTISANDITLAPTVTPLATTTVSSIGIANSIANSFITNNTKIQLTPTTAENAIVVNMTSTGISNIGGSTTISGNNNIQISATTLTGAANSNGINNSGIGTLIANNIGIQVSVAAFNSTTVQGITNSGTTVTVEGNHNMNLQNNLAGNGIINGINNSGASSLVNNNQNITANCSSTINYARIYGITNTALTSSVTNNTGISLTTNSASAYTYNRGINSTVSTIITGNTITSMATAGSIGSTQGIFGTGTISNNSVTATIQAQLGIENTAGIFSDGNSTVSNNTITTHFQSATGNVLGYGINSNNLNSIITGNTIDHTVIHNSNDTVLNWSGSIAGIRVYGANNTIDNNRIVKVFGSMGKGTTFFEIAGIVLETAPDTLISNNVISNVSSNGTADNRTYLSGIYVLTDSLNGVIKNNRIYNIAFNNSITGLHPGPGFATGQPVPANTNGIWIRMSFNTTLNTFKIYNNHISKLYNSSTSSLGGIFGLALSSREVNHTIYHNTILIGDNTNQVTSTITGDFGAAAVGYLNRVGNGMTDLRNNILYVNAMPRGAGYVSALAAIKNHDVDLSTFFTNPGQTGVRPPNYSTTSNNNIFYTPSVHGRRSYLYCEGSGTGTEFNRFNIDHNTTAINDPNFNVVPFSGCTSKYKTLMDGFSSYGTDSDTYCDNLILTEGSGLDEGYWTPSGETYAELGAQVLPAEYDLDSKNISRGSTPDIGALQFSAQVATVPTISYGPISIPGSCGAVVTSLTLTNVHITDTAGVPTSGALVPRLYYQINSGAYVSVAGTLISGNGNDGYWSFTMTGLSAGTINYYVIAQDRLTMITSNPASGLVACNVNSVATHPSNPSSLVIGGGSTAIYALGAWNTLPSLTKAVIFDDNFTSTASIEACSVLVKAGRTVVFNSAHYLLVQNEVTVEPGGTLIFEHNSQLVQINNSTNSGDIHYKRTATVKKLDYVYWSSPVSGFNVENLNTLLPTGPKYKWEPTLPNVNGGLGYWVNAAGNTMTTARGYIVRSPLSFSDTNTAPFTSTFIGVPNNGDITYPIARGNMTASTLSGYTSANGIPLTEFDDNWNLIGNPYPSAISANHFLFENRQANGGSLAGFVNIWRHGIDIQTGINNPFYGSYLYNYDTNDYLTYNLVGASCCPAVGDYKIGAGQGFFVQMIEGNPASSTVTFNNAMRRDLSNSPHDNTFFYRTNENTVQSFELEKHRIWLDLVDKNNHSERILIGYIDGATNQFDSFFDVPTGYKNTLDLFSLTANTHLKTQGRTLPFSTEDMVKIGYHAPESGFYTFAIAALDGLFTDQPIYLKDYLLNQTHDIKASPYLFYTENGYHNERFALVYQNNLLSLPTHSIENQIIVSTNEKTIRIQSSNLLLDAIEVFDMRGRQLFKKNGIQNRETTLSNISQSDSVLLLKIRTEEGTITIKKTMY